MSISIGNYLLERLAQLRVTCIFGVPGDFNLGFLDLVEDHSSIQWVGNCNELNAAYAADGYSRVKRNSIGVLATTFGVGELSAMNGIAGAYAEMVPILHIVGVPSTVQQKSKPTLHHTLGDGRYDAYAKASSQFTVHQAILENKEEASAQIDRALTECIVKARPVYLTLPTDLVTEQVPSERLKAPIAYSPPPNDDDAEKAVVDLIYDRVKSANGAAVVLVDACVMRHGAQAEVRELLDKTGFPVYSAPMGKTAVDECYPRYGGIYIGVITPEDVKDKVENAKVIITIGSVASDYNTGNFTYQLPKSRHIELHSDYTKIGHATFEQVGMKLLLPKLSENLKVFYHTSSKIHIPPYVKQIAQDSSSTISHQWFWPRLADFFKPSDVIVTETGTANFGILDVPLPEKSVLVSQILWGSIGWSLGSCLGASLAARDSSMGRVILFIGDGSVQVTVQEISPMIRSRVKPIIFLLNNKGYTIERYVHGEHRKYNDIAEWDWSILLRALGDIDGKESITYTVHSKDEADQLLNDAQFAKADKIQLVEVMMEMMNAPRALKRQAEIAKS